MTTISQASEFIPPPTSATEKILLQTTETICKTTTQKQGATTVPLNLSLEGEGEKVDLRLIKERQQQQQQPPLPPPTSPPMTMVRFASTESNKAETERSGHKLSSSPSQMLPEPVTPAQETDQVQALTLTLKDHFEDRTVSIGEQSGESEYKCESSEDEDDGSIFSLSYDDTFPIKSKTKKRKRMNGASLSSHRKQRAAAAEASLKNDNANTTNQQQQVEKPRASINQQYCVGTTVSKEFRVPGQQKFQYFRGVVTEYYPDDQLYHIVFEDGDSEDMDEREVAMYLVAPPKSDDDQEEGAIVHCKKAAKVTVKNDDVNPKEHLTIGDAVYAAYWKTKKRDKSYTMFRGTVEAMKQDRWSLSYDIAFDNGQYLESIDKSLVIPEHRYLHENLKQVSAIIDLYHLARPFLSIVLTIEMIQCSQRLEVGQRVVAAWWANALDTASPPAGWYPGVIKACRQLQQGGKFGPDRFYDIEYDDGDRLDDIEDIFVFQESEYELLRRDAILETSAWKGVRNVLDKGSADRWASTVGYWELEKNRDVNERPFSYLGDALRCYDDHIVSCRGANIKKVDLNLPEEWVFDPEAKSPPVRSLIQSVKNDTGRPKEESVAQSPRNDTSDGRPESVQISVAKSKVKVDAKSVSIPEQKACVIREANGVNDDDKKRRREPRAHDSARLASAVKLRQKRDAAAHIRAVRSSLSSLASTDRQRVIKVVEYVQPAKPSFERNEEAQLGTYDGNEPENSSSKCNKRIKPIINRGEHVYAVLRAKDGDASSSTQTSWLPGRVWDFKVKHETSYGPVKTYDIIFDNGEIETNIDEISVMKKVDYDILSDLPDESFWNGVVHYTDPSSNDDYAKIIP
jgi:hypothetical protein